MHALDFFIILGIVLVYLLIIRPIKKSVQEEKRKEEAQRRAKAQKEAEEIKRKLAEEAQRNHEIKMQTDAWYAYQYNEKQRRERERLEQQRKAREEAERRAEEEKRQAEIKRKKELKEKFHYFTLGPFSAAYRYDYFPKNRYPYVDATNEANRRAVWNFKDGVSSIGVRILSDFLEGNYTDNQMRNLTLCVIPASTELKNDKRYRVMCSQICEKYFLANGFNYIQIAFDRSDSREQKSSNTIANLTFSNSVYGKDIILFDDITTRGTSFVQVANELKKKGARSVYGVFIGRTVWE